MEINQKIVSREVKSGQDHSGFVDGGGGPSFRGDEAESIKEAAEWDRRQAKGISNTAGRRVRPGAHVLWYSGCEGPKTAMDTASV